MLSHVLNEIGGLLPVRQLLRIGQPRFDGRRVGQLLGREVPPTLRSERRSAEVRTVGERRRHLARRHRHRRRRKSIFERR